MSIKRLRKVYFVVGHISYEGTDILTVHKSRERAEKKAKEIGTNGWTWPWGATTCYDRVVVEEKELSP